MHNVKKYYIFNTLYTTAFMFCSGAMLQPFLLQAGFSEEKVYLFNSFIQMAQVIMMVVMTFLSGRIKRVKLVTGLSFLPLGVLAAIFAFGAFNPAVLGSKYVSVVFITAGVSYLALGLYTILAYCLPYRIIDMKDYGRVTSISGTLSGVCTFLLSFLHTFVVARFDYMQSMAWFFTLAVICLVLTSATCLSLKENETTEVREKTTGADLIAVFKNKNTYILLVPNFTRGLAVGVISVITVIGMSMAILDEQTSAYVNLITQITLLASSISYALMCRKVATRHLLIISTLVVCLALPISILFGTVGFLAFLAVVLFFRNIMDVAIPVLITEIIPKDEIGAYTSIRMLVFTAAQAVATLIITPMVGVVDYIGLMIFASAMLFICGAVYFAVALKYKKIKMWQNTPS